MKNKIDTWWISGQIGESVVRNGLGGMRLDVLIVLIEGVHIWIIVVEGIINI